MKEGHFGCLSLQKREIFSASVLPWIIWSYQEFSNSCGDRKHLSNVNRLWRPSFLLLESYPYSLFLSYCYFFFQILSNIC